MAKKKPDGLLEARDFSHGFFTGFDNKRGFILSFFCSEKVYIYTCRFTPDFFAGVKGHLDFYAK